MSGREWQCFEAVIWLTYGWNKKQDRVTNTVIAELTGLSDSHVSDALKSLADRKIIFSQKQGVMKTVGINTDLSAWILDKPKTGKVFPKSGKVLPKTGKTFPETVDTQDYNKNNIKRLIYLLGCISRRQLLDGVRETFEFSGFGIRQNSETRIF